MASMGTPAGWRASSDFGMTTSMNTRTDSTGHRQHAAVVDSKTRSQQKTAQNTVNDELDAKLADLAELIAALTATHNSGVPVLATLASTKEHVEKEISAKTKLLGINKERIAIRLSRPESENVYDPAQEQLDNENTVITNALMSQNSCLNSVIVMIKKMEHMQSVLAADLSDKKAAEGLEAQCRGPHRFNKFGTVDDVKHLGSTKSALKPAAQIEDPSVTEEPSSWAAKTQANVAKGQATQSDAKDLCAHVTETCQILDAEINQAHADLQAALKEKLIESIVYWENLMHHKAETEAEIAECLQSKKELEEGIAHKEVPLNTAQARYDIRSQRPEREAVNDGTHKALKNELSDITSAIDELKHKLAEMNACIAMNNARRNELIADLDLKSTSIHLDTDCFVYPGKKDGRLNDDIPNIKKYVMNRP